MNECHGSKQISSKLKKAYRKDQAFLEDLESASGKQGLHVWWTGQSGFLIQWEGQRLFFDPYLSDSLTHKYAETEKPHKRVTQQVVDPLLLKGISWVTSSHNHTDHLDGETLLSLHKANPDLEILVPKANLVFAAKRLGMESSKLSTLSDKSSTQCGPFKLHVVPAAHDLVQRDEDDELKFIGLIAEFGPWTIYHSGDTRWYPEILDTLGRWDIDLAFLPINGYSPLRKVAGNLDSQQAAILGMELDVGIVIPHHYDMFEFNTADPEDFERECKRLGQAYFVMRPGEKWTGSKS